MDILPSIDLRGGKVVRLIQGDYNRQIDYGDDPVAAARQFEEQGARWLHVVDLDGARTGEPANLPVVEAIVEGAGLRIEFGGGVRDEKIARRLLDAGVARVVIGTRALKQWDWFTELMSKSRFANRVMLGLDARAGRLAVEGWTESTALLAVDVARKAESLPLAGIIYTDIATDGMMSGPNLKAVAALAAATLLPVVASGGINSVQDVRNLVGLNVAGAIIGRAIYEGRLSVADALSAAGGE
jgi:phosphoribosylformimino-5-aminoimidazole carboxamide ribotide isomerase